MVQRQTLGHMEFYEIISSNGLIFLDNNKNICYYKGGTWITRNGTKTSYLVKIF